MAENNYTPTENVKICLCCGEQMKLTARFCPVCGLPTSAARKVFCEDCGQRLNEDGICDNCNHSLDEPQNYEIQEETPVFEDIEPPRNTPIDGETLNNEGWSKGSVIKTVVISAVVILFFVFLAWYVNSPTSKYKRAENAVVTNDYSTAYTLYKELGDYQRSAKHMEDCVYEWVEYILENGDAEEAEKFAQTVEMDEDYYADVYAKIKSKIILNTDYTYWHDGYYTCTPAGTAVISLLNTLPEDYEDVKTLSKLFNAMNSEAFVSEIIDDKTFLESVWYIDFVQGLVTSDYYAADFLKGYWSGEGYYIEFYDHEEGGIYSSFDAPWVAKPAGTKYYNIRNMTYIWFNEDSEELAKVYKFILLDINTMDVYCYSDGRTYRMTR